MLRTDKIEALHIVAAGIDAEQKRKRGDKEGYAKAKAFEEELVAIWKRQFAERKNCPHCGQPIE